MDRCPMPLSGEYCFDGSSRWLLTVGQKETTKGSGRHGQWNAIIWQLCLWGQAEENHARGSRNNQEKSLYKSCQPLDCA
jgi:hypothetical protein